mgnify:CR=1 FL=1
MCGPTDEAFVKRMIANSKSIPQLLFDLPLRRTGCRYGTFTTL